MKRLIMAVILFGSITAYANCVRCAPKHTCVAGFAQACLLDDTSCISCGICNGQPCVAPVPGYSTNVPWVRTSAYLTGVESQSQVLGAAVRKLQQYALENKCIQHADGYVTVNGEEYHLKAWATPLSQTVWADGRKVVLTESGWQVYRERKWWFDKLESKGTYR